MTQKIFQSRVSKGIRLFVFIHLAIASTPLLYASEPRTAEGRTNRSAFPLIRFQDRFVPVPTDVEAALRKKIEEVSTPVRLLSEGWFKSTFQNATTVGERLRILESFSETEIWKCSGNYCQGCPGTEQLGCILGAKTPTGYGVVALIHPCLYGEGKCTRKGGIDDWAERFIVSAAYYKLGLFGGSRPLTKVQEASSSWIHRTSSAVNDLLGACPGPYTKKAIDFLVENKSITTPNSALRKCGEKYLGTLRSLPSQCPILKAEMKEPWALFTRKFLDKNAEIFRGDPFSRKMLCRNKEATTIYTLVAESPTLFLLDGACEGEAPTSPGDFLRAALPRALKSRLEGSGCLPMASLKNREEPTTGDLGNGPEIQLEPN